MRIDPSAFKAYDIRGVVGKSLDEAFAEHLGRAFGSEALAAGEGASADEVIEKKGLKQVTDSGAIEAMLDEVLAANAEQVEQYRAADEAKRGKMFGFFVGQAMKASKGKANPGQVNQLLKKKLEG